MILSFKWINLTLFTFSYPCNSRESIVFRSHFLKWKSWWIYILWGPRNPKIIFLAFGLCVCVYVGVGICLCDYNQHNSKTNNSRNIKFGILHLYYMQMLHETFYKDWTKTLCTGVYKRILMHYGLWREFLAIEFLPI